MAEARRAKEAEANAIRALEKERAAHTETSTTLQAVTLALEDEQHAHAAIRDALEMKLKELALKRSA